MYEASSPEPDEAQARAVAALRDGRRFLLSGHVRPDGDCIGAQAALARVLEACGKEVQILNPDPPEPQFDYLSRECRYDVYAGGPVPEHDVSVLLDISELERCGDLAGALRGAPSKKVVVDHHVHRGDAWWDEAFVDVTCSATGLLVYRIARALGVPLDEVAARGVFTSMVTDTGWFRYSNTDAETLAVAGELVAAGVDPSLLFQAIYQRNDSVQPRALAGLLDSLEYHADDRLAVIEWSREKDHRTALRDSDMALDILRSVEPVEVVLFVRETEKGECKLSARSKGDFDVQELAAEFGGGGHVRAAGATLAGPLHDARTRLVEAALRRFAEREVPAEGAA